MTMLYLMLYWYFSRISIHLFLKCLYPFKQQKKELLIRYAEGKFNSFQIIWELCAPLQLWRINPAQENNEPWLLCENGAVGNHAQMYTFRHGGGCLRANSTHIQVLSGSNPFAIDFKTISYTFKYYFISATLKAISSVTR